MELTAVSGVSKQEEGTSLLGCAGRLKQQVAPGSVGTTNPSPRISSVLGVPEGTPVTLRASSCELYSMKLAPVVLRVKHWPLAENSTTY